MNRCTTCISALTAPAPTAKCPAPGALKDYSDVTLTTTAGTIFLVTHHGVYCSSTNSDVEPFNIISGTGKYAGAHGSGVIKAHQTAVRGTASEIFTGTISVVGS